MSDLRTLSEIAARMLTLQVACSRCDRRGRYLLDTLIARHSTLGPESFGEWLKLFVLASAVGPERIRLPAHLPKYWPDLAGDDP